MRFVHIADVHLDTPFASRSTVVRQRLRQAAREAFRRAVSLALDERVDAFLIAGDLFDGERISFETEALLISELSRLVEAGISVVFATGNHDHGAAPSRLLDIAWPDGMSVVAAVTPQRVEIRSRAGEVVGLVTAAGHEGARETRDLARAFPAAVPGMVNVALLHTQVAGARSEAAHSAYAPSTLEYLEGAGYDYWALGHVHLRQSLSTRVPIHYPGNPQGRTPRESGPKGCLLVDLAEGARAGVEFRSTGPLRWVRLALDDLDECRNLDQIVERVSRAWEDWRTADGEGVEPGDAILHLVLTGSCPIWRTLMVEDERRGLAEAVTTRLKLCWTDVFPPRVGPIVELSEHLGRPDVLGEVLRLVGDVASGTEPLPDLGEEELALPHIEPVADRQEYLRGLLVGGQEELVTRIVRTPTEGAQ